MRQGDREWENRQGWGGEGRETRPSDSERWEEELRKWGRSGAWEKEPIGGFLGKSERVRTGEGSGYPEGGMEDGRAWLD